MPSSRNRGSITSKRTTRLILSFVPLDAQNCAAPSRTPCAEEFRDEMNVLDGVVGLDAIEGLPDEDGAPPGHHDHHEPSLEYDEFGHVAALGGGGGAAGGAAVTADEGATGAEEAVFADVLAPADDSQALAARGSDGEDEDDQDVPAAELLAQIEVSGSEDAVVAGTCSCMADTTMRVDMVPAPDSHPCQARVEPNPRRWHRQGWHRAIARHPSHPPATVHAVSHAGGVAA